uniref:Protein BPS1, chloroplastic n=1 Tax=Cajanus cajan TaxID=3821 RepID=A0A151TB23_CAJCA|nr:hypothetical protein KK1_018817 [Cajanus cajan]
MTLAMQTLCESHNDIKTLITELELPVSDWDEKWIDVYFDISVKLLDICNAFSSELSRLSRGHLLLQCVLHNLGSIYIYIYIYIYMVETRESENRIVKISEVI